MVYTFQVLWLATHTHSHQSGCGLEHNTLVNGKRNWHCVTSNLMQKKHVVNFLPIYHLFLWKELQKETLWTDNCGVGIKKWLWPYLRGVPLQHWLDQLLHSTRGGICNIKTIKYSVTGFGCCTQLNIFAFNSFFPGQLFKSSRYVPSHCASL